MTPNQTTGLSFSSALSTEPDSKRAAEQAAEIAIESLGGDADVALLFVTQPHQPRIGEIAQIVREKTRAKVLCGCTAESVIGTGIEVEREPAVSLWLARHPDVTVDTMVLNAVHTGEGFSFEGWPQHLASGVPAGSVLLLLGDPFSFPADALLNRFNEDEIAGTVIGGMASGAASPGQNRLLLNDQVLDQGAVTLLWQGNFSAPAVVSQGCRPIGPNCVVTKSQGNLIQQLGGEPALLKLKEIIAGLSHAEQQLIQRGLHVGRVIDEYKETFGPGDYLIRNVMGADASSGAIAIGDLVRPGQTVRFHLRDADAADEELLGLLTTSKEQGTAPLAGLMFSCNGRGSRLFSAPHHDAQAIEATFGPIPLAGFFAAGEIGPVGGQHFLHGFTASTVFFCDASERRE